MAIAYHGGKQRLGKQIARTIVEIGLDDAKRYDIQINGYCEPFAGMFGVYKHVVPLLNSICDDTYSTDRELIKCPVNYLAGDINQSVVKMWQRAQTGRWIPDTTPITRSEFDKWSAKPHASAQKGFYGITYGFRGIYYCPFRNGVTERRLEKAALKVTNMANGVLANVDITHGEYTQFSDLNNYIIYCDPPYKKQNIYFDENHKRIPFNHDEFWLWCDYMSATNTVIVSEYDAPNEYSLIWESPVQVSGSLHTERLYKGRAAPPLSPDLWDDNI